MKSYIWVTFAFMGWSFYELSGGADFAPEQREVANAATEEPQDVVARAETTLLSLSTSNIAPATIPAVVPAPAPTPVFAPTSPPAPTTVVTASSASATAEEPGPDLREVAGSRVNMRIGPGTDFDVITTLNAGTKLEVLEINADGWANVMTTDLGIEGWMAERLLTDTDA